MAKKVLHILHGFGVGGAETWLLQVARYIQQNPALGWKIDFLVTGGEPLVYDNEVLQTGARIFYVRYSISNLLSFRRKFVTLLKKERYDAIHNHSDFISGWHFLSAIGYLPHKRIAHIHNAHSFVDNYVTSTFRWFSFHAGRVLMALLTTHITGTSNAVMNEYGYHRRPYKKKRVPPAYCGFDVKQFAFSENARKRLRNEWGWSENNRIVLFAGRIGLQDVDSAANQKNPEFAFQLARDIATKNNNWCFVFAGFKGKLGDEMEKEINQLDLAHRIKLLGQRKDMPDIMSAADMLLFPSHEEGLGMVAVEAQANGLPVIASDTIPKEGVVIPELVTFKSLNDPLSAWVEALQQTQRETARGAFYNQQLLYAPFSIDQSVKRLISLYS